jgi:hypothetical protein
MATTNKTMEDPTVVPQIQDPKTNNTIAFTPEQSETLGRVYQLILGWRRERLMRAGSLLPDCDAQNLSITTHPALVAEVEA